MGRIVDYPEITTLSDGDYLIVDNAEGGTKKVSAPLVAGTVDPTPTESSTNAVSSGGVWTSLNDISEEFDGLRTDAYDVYPKGIASGDVVQFETGADNVPLSDLTGYIYPMMSGSGMPSRTNIRTISGPDNINIYQRNKNLIEQITHQSEPETVYLGVQNSSNLTMFFKAGDYRITVNIVGGSTVVPYWAIGSTATHSEYMHLDNDTNVSIYVYDADGISASDIESFQVEVGTEATDYVEFEGDITNVVLPTDRGTIYSGRVALTAGKVYIDTVIYERNSSTMNNTEDKPGWAYTGLQTYDVAIGTFDDVIYWPNGDVRCTNVNVGSTYSVEVANEDYSLILPRDVYNMSQSQWISAGVDIQILVKLNTPIEIDIDPVEVRSLYGFNTYYCNSGKTGVIFGMDLAKYISDKTTDVEDEAKKKIEKAFATDTASGAVATFADGADDIPMKSVKVAIEPVQSGSGDPSPDNVRPISGFTGCEVVRAGKNLFSYDPAKVTTGTTTAETIRAYYPLEVSNCTLSFSAELIDSGSVTNSNINIGKLKDGILSVIGGFIYSDKITESTFTFLENEQAVLISAGTSIPSVTGNFPKYRICVTTGSTPQSYEPYTGDTYPITFPSEAGTVYGGELDVTNGVLTVDRATVDLGTLNWNRSNNNGGWSHYLFFANIQTQTLQKNYMCSVYPIAPLVDIIQSPTDKAIYGLTSNTYIYIRDDDYATATDFKSAVTGQTLVYELAEPITYHLTPTEIKSLFGDNNVWADTGDTTVVYRADTAKYIDKKIAEVINALS